jgi:predicted alpha/beta-hydrolase family hydrolase
MIRWADSRPEEESRQKRKFSRSSIAGVQVVGGHSVDGRRNVMVTKADLAAVSR